VRPLGTLMVAPNEPPFLRGQVSPAQDRRPGSSPSQGHHRCGTAPGSHRSSLDCTTPALDRSARTLPRRASARHQVPGPIGPTGPTGPCETCETCEPTRPCEPTGPSKPTRSSEPIGPRGRPGTPTTRGHGSGATSSNPMAASRAAAERMTTRSACCGPTSCRPTGNPSAVHPAHTEAAGDRVMLKG